MNVDLHLYETATSQNYAAPGVLQWTNYDNSEQSGTSSFKTIYAMQTFRSTVCFSSFNLDHRSIMGYMYMSGAYF